MAHGERQRQRLSPALVATFTSAALLSGAILLVAVLALRDTRRAIDGLIDDYANALIRANDLNVMAHASVVSARGYLLTRKPEYLDEVYDLRARFDAELEALSAAPGLEGSRALAEVEQAKQQYRAAITQAFELAKGAEAGSDALIAFFEQTTVARYERFSASLRALAELQEDRLKQAAFDAQSAAIRGTTRVLLIAAASMLLTLILATVATRTLRSSLSRAYAKAHESTEEVRRRDDLLSMASHDLRNPLNASMLQLAMLERTILREGDGLPAGALRPQLARLRRQISRELEMVEELLDLSRFRAEGLILDRTELDLEPLVKRVVSEFEPVFTERGCKVSLDTRPAVGTWDEVRLEQLLGNLISNAAKFGAGKPIEVALRIDRGYAVLTVRDHGRGVPPEDRERIFAQFERSRAREGGSGLGLWISREIVRAHGGTIRVDEAVGGGATFHVELPCEGAPEHAGATSLH